MPSPFPGMDPYIERPELWSDFHGNLAPEIQAQLNKVLEPRYYAGLTSSVTYDVIEVGQPRRIQPDVEVWQPQPPAGGIGRRTATITPAPMESRIPLETPLRLLSVEIRMVGEDLLVTVIEILSPVNKRPGHEAYEKYQQKRRDLFRSAAHLLEIDLLRIGQRPPLEVPVPPTPYRVVLSRADLRPKVEVWPIELWDPLPVLPVPLREPDPDVPLDLGAALSSVYDRAAYRTRIDYRQPPPPPLSPEEAAWVDELLRDRRGPAKTNEVP